MKVLDDTETLKQHVPAMRSDEPPEISVFLPVYNEEPNLRPLHAKLDAALKSLGRSAEIVYVDDGSNDGSLKILREIAALDSRVTGTILPQLVAALTNSSGVRTGDLVMMNYYDPYQNSCPNSLAYVQELNSHLAADAAQFNVPVANVFTAFGGATTPNPNTCNYTWMCSLFHDIHATDTGYGVIAGAFESRAGY